MSLRGLTGEVAGESGGSVVVVMVGDVVSGARGDLSEGGQRTCFAEGERDAKWLSSCLYIGEHGDLRYPLNCVYSVHSIESARDLIFLHAMTQDSPRYAIKKKETFSSGASVRLVVLRVGIKDASKWSREKREKERE